MEGIIIQREESESSMEEKNEDIKKDLTQIGLQAAEKVWENVSSEKKDFLKDLIKGIPLDRNPLNMLLELAIIQYKMAFGKDKNVTIIGPANVGKSTLYNQFIRNKGDKAQVGPVPGTTRANQKGDAGLFAIIDTPGADAVGNVGDRERTIAFEAANNSDFLIIMYDAIQGIKQTELELFKELIQLNKPHIIVINKIDLTKKFEKEIIDKASINLGIPVEQIIPISALKGDGISRVLLGIAASDPALVVSLAQALPQYRWRLAWKAIVTSASLSAAIALTPLPIMDFIPLVITQSTMVLTIARIFNYKINLKRAQELIGTFGLGMLGRTLFQQFSKLGGLPGWLLSSAIATSMTVVMGYAAIIWFEKGERLSNENIRQLSKKITKDILGSLKKIFSKKPKGKNMEMMVEQVLQQSPLAERETFESTISEEKE